MKTITVFRLQQQAVPVLRESLPSLWKSIHLSSRTAPRRQRRQQRQAGHQNYALVLQYHFPTPELQLNQAIAFLQEHAEEYRLDMTNVIIMGQSGGAVMTAQYGAMISNPEYARLYGITPALAPEAVKCLIIDDAPLIFDHFDRNGKRLLGNFICGTSFPSEGQQDMYDSVGYVNGTYPAAFLIGTNYHGNGYAYDMEQLYDKLTTNGVECGFFYDTYADGTEAGHGYPTVLYPAVPKFAFTSTIPIFSLVCCIKHGSRTITSIGC